MGRSAGAPAFGPPALPGLSPAARGPGGVRRARRASPLGALGCAALWLTVSAAAAQPSEPQRDRAQQRFAEGEENLEGGNYALALQNFQDAYELMAGDPNQPLILFYVGRAHQEIGERCEAVAVYERFLRDTPPDARFRPQAEERARNIQLEMDRLGQSCDRGLGVRGLTGVIVGSVGVLSGLVALGTGIAAHLVWDDVTEDCGPPDADGQRECPGRQDDIDRGRRLAWTSTIALPVFVVAAGLGVTFLVLDLGGGGEEGEPAQLELSPGPGTAGATGTLRF